MATSSGNKSTLVRGCLSVSVKGSFRFFFTLFDERQDAGQMEKADTFDPPRLADGHGPDVIFARPLV